jgi:uncharacterized protein YqhQ
MPDGTIKVSLESVPASAWRENAFLSLPFIRGVAMLAQAMVMFFWGMSRIAQAKLVAVMAAFYLVALVCSQLPVRLGLGDGLAAATVEFAALAAIFAVILVHPRVVRLMQYHGAEHQCANAFQAGAPMTPESVSRFPLAHPRCGTILFAMYTIVAPVLDAMMPALPTWAQFALSIALMSSILEIVLLTASDKWGHRAITVLKPGMWLQRLTVRRPDALQLEVACAATKAVIEAEAISAALAK